MKRSPWNDFYSLAEFKYAQATKNTRKARRKLAKAEAEEIYARRILEILDAHGGKIEAVDLVEPE